ncbi:MAG: putative branched-chain amino transporter, periplasmic binding protein [Bradyrhizobium sp.]|nr:putative branched-chain amino transporter, periplasmic binding protein [Bradyrhizobium sp.]MEA2866985.1 branched-chain amino acid transport system substrate-binding protein [Bradyrhizobium sp.]
MIQLCGQFGRSRKCLAISMITFVMVSGSAVHAQSDGSGISDGVVRIGVLGDYGSGRDLGGPGSVTAAKLAAEDFHNTVLGKPIEIISADHQNKPDVAVGIARQWFDVQHVDAVTDLAVSSVGLAVAGLATQFNRSALVSGAATSELTGAKCSPVITHWADDTYALSAGLVGELSKRVGKDWYFVAVDYSFGSAMVRDASKAIVDSGGKVVGTVRYPFNTTDFSSFLLAAQSSGAKVVALAGTGADTVNAVKQTHEFGLQSSGQTIVGMLTFISDVHSIGLKDAQGMYIAAQYYWDDDDATRAFAKRFFDVEKREPTKLQAATYASVHHYLRAIEAAGTDEAKAVNAEMRKLPVDFFGRPAHIRSDGRVVYDLSLYRVKAPSASRYAWDYYEKISVIPGDKAFRPESDGACNLSK